MTKSISFMIGRKKNIYVKKIGSELSQLVNETILNMRRYLIDKKIHELQDNSNNETNKVLEEVMSYYRLKNFYQQSLIGLSDMTSC